MCGGNGTVETGRCGRRWSRERLKKQERMIVKQVVVEGGMAQTRTVKKVGEKIIVKETVVKQ